MKKRSVVAAITGVAVFATAAFAAVTFDPATGLGFVGKGDVQLAFTWNNAQLQQNAGGVDFLYMSEDRYDVECEWTTVTGGPNSRTIYHDVTIPRKVKVNDNIAYDTRKNSQNQITGFNLTGFDSQSSTGSVPQINDSCPGNNPGTVTSVELVGSTPGGLYVTYGGDSVLLQ